MSQINVTVVGSTTECSLVSSCDTINVTFADQSGGGGTGSAATIAVGSVVTVTATESASVVNSGTGYAAKLDFKIPRGASAGLSIGTVTSGTAAAAAITGTAPSQVLSLTLPPGPPNSLSIGTVTGGTAAAASITGSAPSQVLSLTLPVGSTGSQGPQGDAGPPNSLSIGTVAGGTAAAASITGSAPSQVLSLTLPVGATGPAGPQGPTGPAGPPINLGDETPQPLGTASAGTATSAARADHIHAVPTIAYSSLSGIPSTFAPSAHQHAIADTTGLQAALDTKCPLVNSLIPSVYLPSFVDDVVDVGGTLPATGDVGKIYVVSTGGNANKIYRWSGSTFVEISPSPGSTDAVPEGATNLYHTTKRAADAAPVQSVAGRTGTITLTAADVSGVVSGVNTITGAVTLAAGSNVTLSEAGSTITIASTAVGGIGANDPVDGGFYAGEIVYPNTITITTQPTNQTAGGGSATFTVAASVSPSGSLNYQWQRGDLTLAGGGTWTARTLPTAFYPVSIAYGGSTFAAVSNNNNKSATSSDGVTWAMQTLPATAAWVNVSYGGGKFIAVATAGSVAASSTDGITWTQRTLPQSTNWRASAYGDGKFIAVANSVGAVSTDGASWSQFSMPSGDYQSVAYGNGTWVAVSSNTEQSAAATSTDGSTWTAREMPAGGAWYSVAYGNGVFVAVQYLDSFNQSTSTVAATSTNGVTWTARTLPASASWRNIAFGGGQFVAVAVNSNAVASSADGVTWTLGTLPATASWSVAYGNGTWTAVSWQGHAATSADAVSWSNVSGGSSSSLALTGLTNASDNGDLYRCIVSASGAQSVTSNTAILTVPAGTAKLVGATVGTGGVQWSGLGTIASPLIFTSQYFIGTSSQTVATATALVGGNVAYYWTSTGSQSRNVELYNNSTLLESGTEMTASVTLSQGDVLKVYFYPANANDRLTFSAEMA